MRKRVLTLWDGSVFLALVVLMGCLIAAVAAYHHIYMKTPDYAVAQVIRAAHSGDIETFSQHVDEEALSGQFFDALVSHTSDSTDEAFLLNLVRSPLRSSFVTTADLYLDWTLTGNTDNDEYKKTGDNLQRTLKSAGLSIPLASWISTVPTGARARQSSSTCTMTAWAPPSPARSRWNRRRPRPG